MGYNNYMHLVVGHNVCSHSLELGTSHISVIYHTREAILEPQEHLSFHMYILIIVTSIWNNEGNVKVLKEHALYFGESSC